MKIGDTVRVKRTDQVAEVVIVNDNYGHIWVRFFEDCGEEYTFLFDEVEVINESR